MTAMNFNIVYSWCLELISILSSINYIIFCNFYLHNIKNLCLKFHYSRKTTQNSASMHLQQSLVTANCLITLIYNLQIFFIISLYTSTKIFSLQSLDVTKTTALHTLLSHPLASKRRPNSINGATMSTSYRGHFITTINSSGGWSSSYNKRTTDQWSPITSNWLLFNATPKTYQIQVGSSTSKESCFPQSDLFT